jgi:hypothetical protein
MQMASGAHQVPAASKPVPSAEPPHLQRGRGAILHGLWALVGIYALLITVPWLPPMIGSESIDDSWRMVLHEAWTRGLVYGRDIVFTYGPLGLIAVPYAPSHHWIQLLAWSVIALGIVASARCLASHCEAGSLGPLWAAVLVTALAAQPSQPDAAMWIVGLLLLLGRFGPQRVQVDANGRGTRQIALVGTALLVVAAAVVSLAKFTWLVGAASAIGILTVDDLFRRRRAPLVAAGYVLGVCGLWVLVGQPLQYLVPFLLKTAEVARGYSEAMATPAPGELWDDVLYMLCAGTLLLTMALSFWKAQRWWGILPWLGLAFLLLMAFKGGCIRHDSHLFVAANALLGIVLACAMARAAAISWRRWMLGMGLALLLALAVVFQYNARRASSFAHTVKTSIMLLPRRAVVAWQVLTGAEPHARAYSAAMGRIRVRNPVPRLNGSVDLYPFDQAVVLAHGLDYAPRPIFQSYSAYTERLAQMNAEHLTGPGAPQWILFRVEAIDGRFPALDDGLSWPLLLSRYRVAGNLGRRLLLKRTEGRPCTLRPVAEIQAGFDTPIPLPQTSKGLTWAAIDVHPRPLFHLATALYRPPIIQMTVSTADGGSKQYRLVRPMAAAGFLLSPIVADHQSFATIAKGGSLEGLDSRRVTAVTFTCKEGHARQFFKPTITLRISRLELGQAAGMPGSASTEAVPAGR